MYNKSFIQLATGQTETALEVIPQIPSPSTAAILMYPESPHSAPHEFLMI